MLFCEPAVSDLARFDLAHVDPNGSASDANDRDGPRWTRQWPDAMRERML
jgi:hypothetical protein